jgi:hypothetical protein
MACTGITFHQVNLRERKERRTAPNNHKFYVTQPCEIRSDTSVMMLFHETYIQHSSKANNCHVKLPCVTICRLQAALPMVVTKQRLSSLKGKDFLKYSNK